jgi:hypothetical protein
MKVIIGEPVSLSDYVGVKADQPTVEAATRFLEQKVEDLRNTKI